MSSLIYSNCVPTGKVRNLLASSVPRELLVASSQWYKFRTDFLEFVLLDAALLAFFGNKLTADIGCLRDRYPTRFIQSLVLTYPTVLMMAMLVQEPAPDYRHIYPGTLLVGLAI